MGNNEDESHLLEERSDRETFSAVAEVVIAHWHHESSTALWLRAQHPDSAHTAPGAPALLITTHYCTEAPPPQQQRCCSQNKEQTQLFPHRQSHRADLPAIFFSKMCCLAEIIQIVITQSHLVPALHSAFCFPSEILAC